MGSGLRGALPRGPRCWTSRGALGMSFGGMGMCTQGLESDERSTNLEAGLLEVCIGQGITDGPVPFEGV
jgi:hypothetical protein